MKLLMAGIDYWSLLDSVSDVWQIRIKDEEKEVDELFKLCSHFFHFHTEPISLTLSLIKSGWLATGKGMGTTRYLVATTTS